MELLTKTELIKRYKISERVLHQWRQNGLPSMRANPLSKSNNSKLVYDVQAVEEWLEKQRNK